MKSPRFWTVVALLAGTALLLYARGNTDLIPASEPLSQVPRTIAGWSGSDVQIDQETLDVLGTGDFLSRVYTHGGEEQPDRPLHRLFSNSEDRRHHSFTEELPARLRLGF